VAYAKKKGIRKVSTNTNGQLLTNRLSQELLKAGLDEIFISIDAASKKTYEKIRIGLNYEKVVKNVKNLVKLKKKIGMGHPRIVVDFLKSDLNQEETDIFISQWKGLVDGVCTSQIHDWSAKKKKVVKSEFKNYVSFAHAPCRLPFTELLINWDGTVSLCCQDIEGEVIVGNVKKQSIKEIWQGKTLGEIRKKHLALDINSIILCKDCKLRTYWWTF